MTMQNAKTVNDLIKDCEKMLERLKELRERLDKMNPFL